MRRSECRRGGDAWEGHLKAGNVLALEILVKEFGLSGFARTVAAFEEEERTTRGHFL